MWAGRGGRLRVGPELPGLRAFAPTRLGARWGVAVASGTADQELYVHWGSLPWCEPAVRLRRRLCRKREGPGGGISNSFC